MSHVSKHSFRPPLNPMATVLCVKPDVNGHLKEGHPYRVLVVVARGSKDANFAQTGRTVQGVIVAPIGFQSLSAACAAPVIWPAEHFKEVA